MKEIKLSVQRQITLSSVILLLIVGVAADALCQSSTKSQNAPTESSKSKTVVSSIPAAKEYECQMCPAKFTAAQAKKLDYKCDCCDVKVVPVKSN